MKAIGRNLIIEKTKEGTTKTQGGLLLGEKQKEDIRYTEATILSTDCVINNIRVDESSR